jgi:hypothetical protein
MNELSFDDFEINELLEQRVLINANEYVGTIKGYAIYSNRDDHAYVCYVNDAATVIYEWFPVSDLTLVEEEEFPF